MATFRALEPMFTRLKDKDNNFLVYHSGCCKDSFNYRICETFGWLLLLLRHAFSITVMQYHKDSELPECGRTSY